MVSRRNFHSPPGQSSGRGREEICGQERPALARKSRLSLFMAVRTMTSKINPSVRKMIKFQEDKSLARNEEDFCTDLLTDFFAIIFASVSTVEDRKVGCQEENLIN